MARSLSPGTLSPGNSTPGSSTKEIDAASRFEFSTGLWTVLLIALIVRTGVVWIQFDNFRQDPDAYRTIAECIGRHGIYGYSTSSPTGLTLRPTAFRPPLYPLALSLFVRHGVLTDLPVAGLHVLLGVATVMLTYSLGKYWTNEFGGITSGLLVAIDPLLLQQSTLVMTETLATFMAVAILVAATRYRQSPTTARSILLGMITGMASLCRPTFIPFAGLLGIAVSMRGFKSFKVRDFLIFGVTVVLTLAPWTIRNWYLFGKPIMTTTHGGYTLLLGNNPDFYQYLRIRRTDGPWRAESFHRAWNNRHQVSDPKLLFQPIESPGRSVHRSEIEDDEFAYQAANLAIRAEPESFLRACLVRIGWLWRPAPQSLGTATDEPTTSRGVARILIGTWYLVLFGVALLGAIRLRATCGLEFGSGAFCSAWCLRRCIWRTGAMYGCERR